MSGLAFPLREASRHAAQVDMAFFAILGIAGAILLLLTGLVILFVIRYRHGSNAPRGDFPKALRHEIEIGWIAATTFLAIFIFWWFVGGMAFPPRPVPGQLEIHVVARQWMWKTQHPDGAREIDALHLPIDIPVRLIMTSEDVIHSFYIPAFRLKQDVLPVVSTALEFTPTQLGVFHLFCAEYCGTQHSRMTGEIVIMTQSDYAAWLRRQPHGESLARDGENLYSKFGCGACHAPQSRVQAPKLGGLAGQTITLANGAKVIADDAYLRRSIVSPHAQIVAGFQPIMPSYASIATGPELDALVAYIKTIPKQDTHHG